MVDAVEIFDLYRTTWSGDEYESPKEREVGTFRRRYLADREFGRLTEAIPEKDRGYVHYSIKPRLVRRDQLQDSRRRPSNFNHLEDAASFPDTCGTIRELHASDNVSLAHVTLCGKATKHMHAVMEEIYYVTKGTGYLTIGDERYEIEEGDTVDIPKHTFHFLETDPDQTLELLVVTHPRFTLDDVLTEE